MEDKGSKIERKKSLKPLDKKSSFAKIEKVVTENEKENENDTNKEKQMSQTPKSQLSFTNDQLNNSFTKQNVDDSYFRKTFVKNEKIEINCEAATNKSQDNIEVPLKFIRVRDEAKLCEFMEVFEFLDDLNLTKHYKKFIDNGFETLEKLKSTYML